MNTIIARVMIATGNAITGTLCFAVHCASITVGTTVIVAIHGIFERSAHEFWNRDQ